MNQKAAAQQLVYVPAGPTAAHSAHAAAGRGQPGGSNSPKLQIGGELE